MILAAYVDRTWRIDVPGTINDELYTYDIDLQHNFSLGSRHSIVWGAGYRLMNDNAQHTTDFVAVLPEHRQMHLFSSFLQDEISLIPLKVSLTVGSKLQHTEFSSFEMAAQCPLIVYSVETSPDLGSSISCGSCPESYRR